MNRKINCHCHFSISTDLNEIIESQYLLSRSVEPHALIIGLLPNTYYWVRVMAYNSAGPGPESERFLERTFKLRPQKPPTAVQVKNLSKILAIVQMSEH